MFADSVDVLSVSEEPAQVGDGLAGTVATVIRDENKRHKARAQEDAEVHEELRAALQEEEAGARRARLAFQAHMAQEKEKARVKRESLEATDRLNKVRKEQREAEAAVAAMEQVRAYSLDQLGKREEKLRHCVSSESAFASIAKSAQSRRVVARANEPMGVLQNSMGQ